MTFSMPTWCIWSLFGAGVATSALFLLGLWASKKYPSAPRDGGSR